MVTSATNDVLARARGGGRRASRGLGRHRLASVAAGLTVVLGSLAACGGGDGGGGGGGGGGEGDTGTLTFVHAQDPGTFDQVIASFEEANPGITIEEQAVPFDDLNSTVQARLGEQDASIDLYDVDAPRLASFAARGFLEPLPELAEKAGDSLDATAMESGVFDGTQFAMPRWTSTQLLFFNRTLLTEAGVELPSSDPAQPMTWEDLAAAGKKAQEAGAEWGMTFDQVGRYYQLQPLPESLGGGSGLSGPDGLTPDVTNDAWIEAFTWYASTFEDGIAPRGVTPEQTPALFASGDTAFFVGGPWNTRSFVDAPDLDYGVAPFPKFAEGEAASSTGSWLTGVSPFSDNKEAAADFIEYMTTDATGAEEVTSNNIPVHQEAQQVYLETMAAEGEGEQQLADIIQYELANNAVARPTSVGFVEFETTMNSAFDDIANGADVEERLQQASEELERALARYQD